MLPSGQTIVNEVLNGMINDSDNSHCDIDDANTNNNDLLTEPLNGSELNFSTDKFTSRSTINGATTMTIPQISDSLGARRPSAISVKPIVTDVNGLDSPDGCFGSENDPLRSEIIGEFRSRGINVSFEQLIYQKRYGLCWNRGECNCDIYELKLKKKNKNS